MDDTVISVKNVSKAYRLWNNPAARLRAPLWDSLGRCLPGRYAGKCFAKAATYFRDFYALKDVSFEVKKGESVGIIGRNGSGKSTLLQIIAGTLQPTSGTVEVRGRVAALLELGSGFNPEFTGRENVYMNAAILGLTREETEARFDAIASFADIGQFLDQPVKVYSSGMLVRLAFATAINVVPDILIIDEALAVGDMSFQAKCITALTLIKKTGVVLLFVTHDVGSIKNLCSRAFCLANGSVLTAGPAADVAEHYIRIVREEINNGYGDQVPVCPGRCHHDADATSTIAGQKNAVFKTSEEFTRKVSSLRYGTGEAFISFCELLDEEGTPVRNLEFGQTVVVEIYFESRTSTAISPNYYILDDKKNYIFGANPILLGQSLVCAKEGERYSAAYRTTVPLQEGVYSIQLELTAPIVPGETARFLDVVNDSIVFRMSRRRNGRVWGKVFIPTTLEIRGY